LKTWAPEHLRLASTAVNVRDKLRSVEWAKLDPRSAAIIAWSVRALSSGLKARTYRPRNEAAAQVIPRALH
jgi:hypothetical protein